MMMRTLVADRDETIRAGIRSILTTQSCASMIDEVTTRSDLIQKVESKRYDLIIVEPFLDDGREHVLIKSLREAAPSSNVLVFTALDELTHGVRAINSGAKGFLMKSCSVNEFLTAVQRVGQGRVNISSALAEKCAKVNRRKAKHTAFGDLSEREIDVYAMLVTGKRVTEIARYLNLSAKTVSTHKTRTFVKLSCANLSSLVSHAIAHGLVEDCRARCAKLMNNLCDVSSHDSSR